MKKHILAALLIGITIILCCGCRRKGYTDITVFDQKDNNTVVRKGKELGLEKNMKLISKDEVSVSDDGFVRLCLDDDIFAFMESKTKASIVNKRRGKIDIAINTGELIVEVQKKLSEDEAVNIHTPNTLLGIRGTVVAVKCVNLPDGSVQTVNYILEGKCDLEVANGETIHLEAGEGWQVETNAEGEIVESEKADSSVLDFKDVDISELKGASGAELNPDDYIKASNDVININLPGIAGKDDSKSEDVENNDAEIDDAEKDNERSLEENVDRETFEIALVTYVAIIDGVSKDLGAWEGVVKYAEDAKKTYHYVHPYEDSTDGRVDAIGRAILEGAKVVICSDFTFEDAIFELQDLYPNVMFLLLDGEQPHNADYSMFKTAENTHVIRYKEEQAGFLAGYAAVKEGYRKLGFLSGLAIPEVIRYGYGFIQGANVAAEELGVAGDVSVKYWYSGTFAPSDDVYRKMYRWYSDGTEVIFSCGDGPLLSCARAAEFTDKKVICSHYDMSSESETIITSAMKEYANSVVLCLTELYKNNRTWPANLGGKIVTRGAEAGCVGLPTANWRMKNFTIDQYNDIFTKLKNGTVTVSNSTDTAPSVSIKVDYQK